MLRTRTGSAGSAASGAATANYVLQEALRPENAALAVNSLAIMTP
jgi:hypothetical protein